MSTKSALLIALGIAVLVMGVYLFIQVRSSAHATPPSVVAEKPAARPAPIHVESPPPPPPPQPQPQPQPQLPPPETPSPPNVKLDEMMQLASKAYDRQDFDEAISIAGKILNKDPTNVKMLRIMVSSNCIQGDGAVAQQYYEKLPKFDRDQMRTRCDRYGVTFKEPAQ